MAAPSLLTIIILTLIAIQNPPLQAFITLSIYSNRRETKASFRAAMKFQAASASSTGTNNNKLVLLDRDGVINEDVGSPGVTTVEQLRLTQNAGKAIGRLKRAGYPVALITNQSCVGKGLISHEYLMKDIMATLQKMVLEEDPDAYWDDIFVCTSTTDVVDKRRKPNPGMILEACKIFQVPPEEAVFVGDTISDMQAAVRAGVPMRILVSTGYGSGIMDDLGYSVVENENDSDEWEPKVMDETTSIHRTDFIPFVYVKNLKAAMNFILQQSSGNL